MQSTANVTRTFVEMYGVYSLPLNTITHSGMFLSLKC